MEVINKFTPGPLHLRTIRMLIDHNYKRTISLYIRSVDTKNDTSSVVFRIF
jgi:hypothetical protein